MQKGNGSKSSMLCLSGPKQRSLKSAWSITWDWTWWDVPSALVWFVYVIESLVLARRGRWERRKGIGTPWLTLDAGSRDGGNVNSSSRFRSTFNSQGLLDRWSVASLKLAWNRVDIFKSPWSMEELCIFRMAFSISLSTADGCLSGMGRGGRSSKFRILRSSLLSTVLPLIFVLTRQSIDSGTPRRKLSWNQTCSFPLPILWLLPTNQWEKKKENKRMRIYTIQLLTDGIPTDAAVDWKIGSLSD